MMYFRFTHIILVLRSAKWFHLSYPTTTKHVSKSIHSTMYTTGCLLSARGTYVKSSARAQYLVKPRDNFTLPLPYCN